MKKKLTDPPRSILTPESVDAVGMAVVASSRRFTRRQSLVLGISRTSVECILHEDLNFICGVAVTAKILANY